MTRKDIYGFDVIAILDLKFCYKKEIIYISGGQMESMSRY